MVFGPKTIGKTIANNGFWTKNHWKTIATNGFGYQNHRKTIDINGGFQTIHSMAIVSIKTFKCCNGGNHKANIELK